MKIVIEKNNNPSPWMPVINGLVSILLALLFCGVILIIVKVNPIEAYSKIFSGAFGSGKALAGTLIKAVPFILCGLGVAVAFKMQLWNIGAEGQLYMGAIAGSFVAMKLGHLNPWLVIPLMLIAGFIAGGLWGAIAGTLRAYGNANEVITTLMLNYIAVYWVDYLVYGPWKDPQGYGFPMTEQFNRNTWFPTITGTKVHIGLFIGIALSIIIYIIINKSLWGYEIRVTGANPKSARYAGINISKNIVAVMFLSGALAGLAGITEIGGIQHRLQHGFSSGYGYTAIIVAWLARLHPFVILLSSFLFGGLLVGGDQLQISMQLPVSFTYILQGAILFFILGGEIFSNYKIRLTKL